MDINKRGVWKIERFHHHLYGDCLIIQFCDKFNGEKIEIWKLKDGN